jgi:hypothetical protein
MHFSHASVPSFASAPHAHAEPSRQPFRRCLRSDHLLIGPGQSSFRGKVWPAARRPPCTIGTGEPRVPWRVAPNLIASGLGAARLPCFFLSVPPFLLDAGQGMFSARYYFCRTTYWVPGNSLEPVRARWAA